MEIKLEKKKAINEDEKIKKFQNICTISNEKLEMAILGKVHDFINENLGKYFRSVFAIYKIVKDGAKVAWIDYTNNAGPRLCWSDVTTVIPLTYSTIMDFEFATKEEFDEIIDKIISIRKIMEIK